MIKINLLPEELRKKRQFNNYILMLLGTAVGLFLIVVMLSLFLGIQLKVQARRYHRLDAEWKIMEKEEKEVLGLEKLKTELDVKKEAIENLSQSRLLWSKKLYQLSKDVPASIWLSELNMTSRREKIKVPIKEEKDGADKGEVAVTWVIKNFQTLVIKGIVISLAGEEMIDSVGNFMTKLKSDEDFFSDFSDVELIFTQRKNILDKEVMAFELACQFK